ncbi:MAG: hypothetical protein H0W08_19765 [Acidobacteria bacterium]|nr:hypothetical protein [Acidobacteriota bacterium]
MFSQVLITNVALETIDADDVVRLEQVVSGAEHQDVEEPEHRGVRADVERQRDRGQRGDGRDRPLSSTEHQEGV